MKIIKLLSVAALCGIFSSCSSTGGGGGEPTTSYRKPSSGAAILKLKNNTEIGSESDLNKLAKDLKGSTVKKSGSVYTWDLKGGILDGKNQKGDGGQGENQEPLFRAKIPLVLKNGFVQNNKDAATFYGKGSGVEKVTFTKIGEDAITTAKGAEGFTVKDSQFINRPGGDKSIQLNEGKNARVENNLISSGITGVRLFESSFSSSSDKAYVRGNKFINVDTAFNVAVGTVVVESKNSYEGVRIPYKLSKGGKVSNADGNTESD